MVDKVVLLATNNIDRTITVVADGVKYEYWVEDAYEDILRRVRKLQIVGAYGKIIMLLKHKSVRYDKLTA